MTTASSSFPDNGHPVAEPDSFESSFDSGFEKALMEGLSSSSVISTEGSDAAGFMTGDQSDYLAEEAFSVARAPIVEPVACDRVPEPDFEDTLLKAMSDSATVSPGAVDTAVAFGAHPEDATLSEEPDSSAIPSNDINAHNFILGPSIESGTRDDDTATARVSSEGIDTINIETKPDPVNTLLEKIANSSSTSSEFVDALDFMIDFESDNAPLEKYPRTPVAIFDYAHDTDFGADFDLEESLLEKAINTPAASSEDLVGALGQPAKSSLEKALLEDASDSPAMSPNIIDRFDFRTDLDPDITSHAENSSTHSTSLDELDALDIENDSEFDKFVPEDVSEGPVAALAFALDSTTEDALRKGLFDYEGPSPGLDSPQIWAGNLSTAVATLGGGLSTQLIFVDVDGVSYPAGAIHELAAVCDVGTVVIAVGSNETAQFSRELLHAGVSDYLVKPITTVSVREAITRTTSPSAEAPAGGCVVGFTGIGGGGITTLATATALSAAKRGRYVSVLDLKRMFPAAALQLDVDPAPGLDQLFESAALDAADPEMVDGVCAKRSDRVEIYSYCWSPSPPSIPHVTAVDWLIKQLRRRSQLVLIDGLDDLDLRLAVLDKVDTRVLVVDPIPGDAIRNTRMLDLLGEQPPVLIVQNHTRAFKYRMRDLRDAGLEVPPDVIVPFEPSLPGVTDRGWPQGRFPRSLRKPLATLTQQILTSPLKGVPGTLQWSRGL